MRPHTTHELSGTDLGLVAKRGWKESKSWRRRWHCNENVLLRFFVPHSAHTMDHWVEHFHYVSVMSSSFFEGSSSSSRFRLQIKSMFLAQRGKRRTFGIWESAFSGAVNATPFRPIGFRPGVLHLRWENTNKGKSRAFSVDEAKKHRKHTSHGSRNMC